MLDGPGGLSDATGDEPQHQCPERDDLTGDPFLSHLRASSLASATPVPVGLPEPHGAGGVRQCDRRGPTSIGDASNGGAVPFGGRPGRPAPSWMAIGRRCQRHCLGVSYLVPGCRELGCYFAARTASGSDCNILCQHLLRTAEPTTRTNSRHGAAAQPAILPRCNDATSSGQGFGSSGTSATGSLGDPVLGR